LELVSNSGMTVVLMIINEHICIQTEKSCVKRKQDQFRLRANFQETESEVKGLKIVYDPRKKHNVFARGVQETGAHTSTRSVLLID